MKPTPLPIGRIKSELEMAGGDVVWKTPGKSRSIGKRAGSVTHNGITIRLDGRPIWAHRVAWFLHHGEDPADQTITHLDGDRTNNAKDNLLLFGKKTEDGTAKELAHAQSKVVAHLPTGLYRLTAFYENAHDAEKALDQCKRLVNPTPPPIIDPNVTFGPEDWADDEIDDDDPY